MSTQHDDVDSQPSNCLTNDRIGNGLSFSIVIEKADVVWSNDNDNNDNAQCLVDNEEGGEFTIFAKMERCWC